MLNAMRSGASEKSTFGGKILALLIACIISASTFAQDITNTLGPGGMFKIKDVATDFLTLSQSTGQLNILKTLRLENTSNSTTGIIFKGTNRFIHNYYDGISYNTFMGTFAGNFTLTTANENTGIGYSSLNSLTTGDYNTALGRSALNDNTTGYSNTAAGYFSLATNTTGYQNTAMGDYSLFANTTGYRNTALGYYALSSNTTGVQNTAMGYYSLSSSTTGNFNTSVGFNSLRSNTTGLDNTSIGYQALYSNTTGEANISVGGSSLRSNTIGTNNVALGYQSLYSNTSGNYNASLGSVSLYHNTTGLNNTALGYQSLYSNTDGVDNTAVGHSSLYLNTTGDYNTALGYSTGSTITTGSNLTCIGYNAEPTSASATNQITLGNASVTSLRCNVTTITSLSDARDKKNIKDLDLGIDFLMKIKPRQFNWDKREWYENNTSDGSKMKEEPTAGFIAQELDDAQTTENAEWLNLVLKDNPEKWEATPGNLLPIMVKAIQELNLKCGHLKAENEQLKIQLAETNELRTELSELGVLTAELKDQIKNLKANNNSEEIKLTSLNNERIEK